MTDPAIRDATTADVEGVRRVARRGWRAAYSEILAPETIERALAEWYDPDLIREAIDRRDGTYVVAEESETILGYASGGLHEEGSASLSAIYVDPDRWSEGIGTALLDAVTDSLRERGAASLRVRVLGDNDVGRSFYRSSGFERVDEQRTALFGEQVTECVLETSL